MGNLVCKRKEISIVILGLDGVGKTTLLYHLKLGEVVGTIPTIGYNTEYVNVNGIEVTMWDIFSRCKARALWRHFYGGKHGYVFVIDSTDRERLSEAKEELYTVFFDDKTRDTVVMILANKQDWEGAISAQELEDSIAKWCSSTSHTIFVMPCSALDKNQVTQAFTYFIHLVCMNQAGKLKPGLITLKQQQLEMEESSEESAFKSLLKDPYGYLKSFF